MAPRMLEHPQDVTLIEGSQLHLVVRAEGTLPMSFGWYHAGQRLESGDAAELSIREAALDHAGGYYCEVSMQFSSRPSHKLSGHCMRQNAASCC